MICIALDSMIWISLLGFLASAFMAIGVLRWMRGRGVRYGEDMPQRFHSGEVPRLGGLAILVGLLVAWAGGVVSFRWLGDPSSLRLDWWVGAWMLSILPAVLGGIAEDYTQRLTVAYRLGLTLLSALLAVFWLDLAVPRLGWELLDSWMAHWPWIGMAIALLAVAGLPHAFNIIDGYNGLAGMVAVAICLAMAYVALQVGDRGLAAMLLSLAAATGGFLLWNYPRGVLFAGDGGAYIWGIVIALCSIALVQRHPQVSPWFPMLLLMYPVWETVFSSYRKIARGVSPGVADALHFHQLIYRRIVRGVFDEDMAQDMLSRNNRTSPYLWGFSMLTVVPAVLFWKNTFALMLFCVLFVAMYVSAYMAIIHFKVPHWLRRS